MSVVTRIAPSPTGYLHFGLARTGLFCYLFAKKHGGTFILRIEDTDLTRNAPEFEVDIHEQFAWLGLTPDAVYKQSEHQGRHTEALAELIAKDLAYVSKEPAKDDPGREVEVVRLRNKGEIITFTDLIRGEVTFDTTELKDFVIARSRTEPLFHLAVVVDDNDEGVTHVIRGEDHVSNTQRHLLLQRALGFERPQYAHLPLILLPDKSKMSKRREGSSVKFYRDQGILPPALINYIALLGWNPGTEQELFTLPELIDAFEIEKIQKSGAVFDVEKLHWYNRQYIAKLSQEEFAAYAAPVLRAALEKRGVGWNEAIAHEVLLTLRERIDTSADITAMTEAGELDFFFADPPLDASRIPQKGVSTSDTRRHLERVKDLLSKTSEDAFSDPERIKAALWEYAGKEGRGAVLWPLRYALTGLERSPDPFEVAHGVGKEATLRRIDSALSQLSDV